MRRSFPQSGQLCCLSAVLLALPAEPLRAGECDLAFDAPVPAGPDCNGNGYPDECDVAPVAFGFGRREDIHGDGISLPRSLALRDLDRDGDLDLAGLASAGAVFVLLGEGGGRFAEPHFYSTEAAGAAVLTAGDLDGDGDADLAAASAVSYELSVFLNDGQGVFALPSKFPLGAYPAALAVADLDRDGDLDLAVADSGNNGVTVLSNDGSGAFGSINRFHGGLFPVDIVARDLDADGDVDLATASHGSGKLSVLLNQGRGSFGDPVEHESSGPPAALAAEDFDGDGDIDVASISHWGRALTLFENPGKGGFSRRSTAVAFDPVSMMAADLDLDGRMDLVTSNLPGSCELYRASITLLLGSAGFSFLAPREIKMGKSSVLGSAVAGDMDSDGDVDLVLPRFDQEPTAHGGLAVLWNDPSDPHGDCDADGVPDDCELQVRDCNTNGIPDSCDLRRGMSQDCDADGTPDECERDCDHNGRADECDLAQDPGRDIDRDGIPDDCEPATPDCNGNGTADAIEIRRGGSSDCNANGLPDECETAAVPRFELRSLARYALDAPPASAALADLDGDGDLDAAVTLEAAQQTPIQSGSMRILLNAGRGRLEAAGRYAAVSDPAVVLSGDFEGDGDADLALLDRPLSCQGEPVSFVSVLSNRGQASFSLASRLALAGDHPALTAGDLDGDGDADLAVGRTAMATDGSVSGEVTLLLNDGRGSFAPGAVAAFTGGAAFLVAADLDADRDLDLAAAGAGSHSAAVLWNDGGGRYVAAMDPLAAPGRILSLAAVDLDRDGRLEIIAGALDEDRGRAGAAVTVFWGEPGGIFERTSALPVPGEPHALAACDLDGDGDAELATAGIAAGGHAYPPRSFLSILGNLGDRTVPEPMVHWLDAELRLGAPGDLDGDGDPDLALLNVYPAEVIVLPNSGDGTFPSVPAFPDNESAVALIAADFDDDGAKDLALAGESSGTIRVFRNLGDASFLPERRVGLVEGSRALVAADLDGQGGLDLAVAGEFLLGVLLNDGAGVFTPGDEIVIGSNPASVAAADLDGDGDIDLATANALDGALNDNVSVLFNAGAGAFGFPRNLAAGRRPRAIVAADLDRDGDIDLAIAHSGTGDVWLLHNAGDGGFPQVEQLAAGSEAYQLRAADLSGDGALDLVVTRPYAILLYRGMGDGAFGEPAEIRQTAHNSLALSDVELDGDIDLVAFFSETLGFLPNRGDGTFGELETLGAGKGVGLPAGPGGKGGSGDPVALPQTMAAADLDADGDEDLATAWLYQARLDIHTNQTPRRLADLDGNGTPDVCEDPGARDFRRGDARDDGRLDISDAVTILRHLFLTGEPLPWAEAADANDDGAVNLSDAVRILGFLFLGDEPLPAPRQECGRDPTEDALSCQAYAGC